MPELDLPKPGPGSAGSSRLAIVALAAAGAAALAISLFIAFSDTQEAAFGPSTYSRSAIGHQALLEILRRQGIDASASRGASVAKTRNGGLLVLAEPDFQPGGKQALQHLLRARTVLLVLPKWTGAADQDRRGWLNVATTLPLFLSQSVLDDTGVDGSVQRATHTARFDRNLLGPPPHLADPPQLLHGDTLQPLISGPDGTLLGRLVRTDEFSARRGPSEIFVLSDPDVIANHGMATGNAALAVALIERARHGGPVVFDETIHGFVTVPNGRLRMLYARPFVAATLNVLLACAMLLWAGRRRFGATLPRPVALRPGKLALIDNIADLLLGARRQSDLLRRYIAATIEDVAARLHAPDTADGSIRAAWLAQAEARRGMARGAAEIAAAAHALDRASGRDGARLFALAADIFAWKTEILHGPARTGPDGRIDPGGNPQGRGGAGGSNRPDAGEPAGRRPRAA